MAELSYRKPGLVIRRFEHRANERQIRDLQRDLRRLGYLSSGIDGDFGSDTERAVKALQYDLLNNDGASTRDDGCAPVSILDHNRGRVVAISGAVDQGLVECISDMLDNPDYSTLPYSRDAIRENQAIVSEIAAMASAEVPIPFLLALLVQESSLKHFHEPKDGDEDAFINMGLDTNAGERYIITARSYGVGQYPVYHHPPRKEEVDRLMLDIGSNVQRAVSKLREKFDHCVNGASSGTAADDRIAEYGRGPLRLCRYHPGDPRYMRDCQACLGKAAVQDIRMGITPFFAGCNHTFQPTQYYKALTYRSVPMRKQIGCDWPYAVRRYNGAGVNSYHYQVRVLQQLRNMAMPEPVVEPNAEVA
jgi:hypothetical protein